MKEEDVLIYDISRHRLGTDGVGVTTLVTLRECPLKCKYCINEDCHIIPEKKYTLNATKVVEKCRIDNLYFVYTNGGITIGGGEALMHPRFIHELRERMPENWKLCLETSLNVPQRNVEMIVNDIAEWIIDIKDMNPDIYKRYTECNNKIVRENLTYLSSLGLQDKCLIRIPMIPEYNNEEDRQQSILKLQALGYNDFDLFDYILPADKEASKTK